MVASLDLSSAFDVVDIKLLIKRLKIFGLPSDVIELIEVWLNDRMYYVSLDGQNSILYDLLLGTVQGSILGPFLYAIFVSPIFDNEFMLAFADDIFVPITSNSTTGLIDDMEKTLESITKWLKKSGLVVNDAKTDLCLFYKKETQQVSINLGMNMITSKNVINVLGVTFDSRLQWSEHVSKTISKANRALCAIKLIRRFFNTKELTSLLTSNFYSILYYNSEIWHLNSLNQNLKHSLLVASANACKLALHYPNEMISYLNLHSILKRATPEMICKYKLALQLFKKFNHKLPDYEWLILNFEQQFATRQTFFKMNRINNLRVGLNALSNRFFYLNDKIPLTILNNNIVQYKIACKKIFLTFN